MFYRKRLVIPVYTLSKVHHDKGCSDWTNYFKSTKSLCSLWESLLFFQETHLNQISNHTLEWEELQEGKIPAQYWKQLFLLRAKPHYVEIDYDVLWQASMRLWVMENPGLLPCWSLEGALGRRNSQGFWMGTRRQALPPVEWRPEPARSSPYMGTPSNLSFLQCTCFLLFLLYCVIWCHPVPPGAEHSSFTNQAA